MKKFVGKIGQGLGIVNLQPDQVRRVVVEAEMVAGNRFEHPSPDGGRKSQVLPTRPLIVGEKHGAVFDADADIVLFR